MVSVGASSLVGVEGVKATLGIGSLIFFSVASWIYLFLVVSVQGFVYTQRNGHVSCNYTTTIR